MTEMLETADILQILIWRCPKRATRRQLCKLASPSLSNVGTCDSHHRCELLYTRSSPRGALHHNATRPFFLSLNTRLIKSKELTYEQLVIFLHAKVHLGLARTFLSVWHWPPSPPLILPRLDESYDSYGRPLSDAWSPSLEKNMQYLLYYLSYIKVS